MLPPNSLRVNQVAGVRWSEEFVVPPEDFSTNNYRDLHDTCGFRGSRKVPGSEKIESWGTGGDGVVLTRSA